MLLGKLLLKKFIADLFVSLCSYNPKNDGVQSMKPLISGVLSKIISLTVMYPATLVRTRIQQNQYLESTEMPKYVNLLDIIGKTWKLEGPRGFYKGYSACMLRTLPSSAIFWFFFEFFKETLPF